MRNSHNPGRPGSRRILLAAVVVAPLVFAAGWHAAPAWAQDAPDTLQFRLPEDTPDTLQFEPVPPTDDWNGPELEVETRERSERSWLQDPFHHSLLSHNRHVIYNDHGFSDFDGVLEYNRVDEVRLGFTTQAQGPWDYAPRFATEVSYTTGRKYWLYDVQLEQPLDRSNIFGIGAFMYRATDHLDLNQVNDFENSLALLFGKHDYRDYFERVGVDAYAAFRWPGVTTMSAHFRDDRYRTLPTIDVQSWVHNNRALRPNPAIDDGDIQAVAVRLERHASRTGGLYHWVEFETAGHGLGGDFEYQRGLADLRTVVRVSPGMRLTLRGVGGSALNGDLPAQREFTVGGVDGLRAHSFAEFRGDQVALGQAEYTIGFGEWRKGGIEVGGIHAMFFLDAGHAWTNPTNDWDPAHQKFAVDGGFGIGTDEDDLRIYFARNLQSPDSDFVISARLQRPF